MSVNVTDDQLTHLMECGATLEIDAVSGKQTLSFDRKRMGEENFAAVCEAFDIPEEALSLPLGTD